MRTMDNDEESQSATQGHLFDPRTITMRKADPVASIANAASAYTGGKWSSEGLDNTMAKGPEGFTVYKMHERNMTEPPTPDTIKSYEMMREHLGRQFDHLTAPVSEGGAGINVEVVSDNPYETFEGMHNDVMENNRLKILSTRSTAPPETPDKGHSFFTNEENDKFRAVHDAYGHLAIGRNFDRHGEEAAYQSHRQMFPEGAHAALASETRGQNSYLNWGGEDFPPNVMVNTPNWATKKKIKPPQPKRDMTPQSAPQELDL